MSSLCLSSVLTHANLTMYQTGPSDIWLQQPAFHPCFSPQNNITAIGSSTSAQPYTLTSPCQWNEDQVLEWISDHVDHNKIDAKSLDLKSCSVSGFDLCQMKKDEVVDAFGQPVGQQLYQSLQEHILKNELQNFSAPELSETCTLLDDFWDNLSFPRLSTIQIGSGEKPVGKKNCDYKDEYDFTCQTMQTITTLDKSDSYVYASSPDSSSSESELDSHVTYTPCSRMDIKMERRECQPKRPRGRPPKVNKEDSNSLYGNPKKSKHAPRGSHLWEFIRDILIHPENNHGLMKWEDRREGVFRFLKSEAVAQMWGQRKKNSTMTYEKLSRAMRYYYKREILERVDGRRLVYKFGKNSNGWKMEEICTNTGSPRMEPK